MIAFTLLGDIQSAVLAESPSWHYKCSSALIDCWIGPKTLPNLSSCKNILDQFDPLRRHQSVTPCYLNLVFGLQHGTTRGINAQEPIWFNVQVPNPAFICGSQGTIKAMNSPVFWRTDCYLITASGSCLTQWRASFLLRSRLFWSHCRGRSSCFL
jgi:hypothetical protein